VAQRGHRPLLPHHIDGSRTASHILYQWDFWVGDPDGDASVWTGLVHPETAMGSGKIVTGAGKYVSTDLNPTLQTTVQIDETHSNLILNSNPYSLTAKD